MNFKEAEWRINVKELITVIIPVYKVEKYLERCLESVVNQSYSELEIILVDDGSPDRCGVICDKWVQKDNRIKVIHKKNEGLGCARNTGLENASGKFVIFVDSDDYIKVNACERAIACIHEESADGCYFEHMHDYNGEIETRIFSKLKPVYEGKDIIFDFMANTLAPDITKAGRPPIGMSACKIMYRREIIEKYNLRFCSEREYLSEDLFFRLEFCKVAKKIVTLSETLYCYCHNGTSLTTSYRPDRFQAASKMFEKLIKDCKNVDEDNVLRIRCTRSFMGNILVCIKHEIIYMSQNGKKRTYKNIEAICKNILVQKELMNYPISNMPIQTRLLFCAIKKRMVLPVVVLVRLKLQIDKHM